MFASFVQRSHRPFLALSILVLALVGGCNRSQTEQAAEPETDAQQMIAEQRYGEAITKLDERVKQASDDGEAFYWRGLSHQNLGHIDHALQDYTSAIRHGYNTAAVYRARGELYLDQKLGDVAALDFDDALRLQPDDAELLCKLAEASLSGGRWDRAVVAARQAIRLRPNYMPAYKVLAAAAQESPTADFAEAIAALERARRLAPKDDDIKIELTRVYCRQAERFERVGDIIRAKALWQAGEALDATAVAYYRHKAPRTGAREPNRYLTARVPTDASGATQTFADDENSPRRDTKDEARQLAESGRKLLEAGNTRAAIEKLTAALARDSKSAEYFLLRGQAFCAEKSLESAIADYTEAIRLDPNLAQAYAKRGRAYRLIKNAAGAIYDLTEAMRLDPSLVETYLERGQAYFDKARYDLALADYDNALKRDPRRAEEIRQAQARTYLRLGQQQVTDGHWDEAITKFEQAEKFDPTLQEESKPLLAEALRGRALVNAERSVQRDAALADAHRALKLESQNAKSYETLARVQIKRAEWPAAIENAHVAMQLDPSAAGNLRVTLAAAYRGWGDELAVARRYAEALPQLSRAVDLSPMNGRHLLARGVAYYYLGRLTEARDDFNTALRRAPELDPQVSPYLTETNNRLGLPQVSSR